MTMVYLYGFSFEVKIFKCKLITSAVYAATTLLEWMANLVANYPYVSYNRKLDAYECVCVQSRYQIMSRNVK